MAGFHVFYGNKLEKLADECAGLLKTPLDDPLAREMVVVPGSEMKRWLTLQLSIGHGVCANVDFRLPNEFIDVVFHSFLGDRYRPEHFSIDVAAWKIMKILPGLVQSEREMFQGIGNYLRDDHVAELKLYQLSRKIAHLFDQYAIYRPELTALWEDGRLETEAPDEAWQMLLWRRLFEDASPGAVRHRARVKDLFLSREQGTVLDGIPPRLVFFGTTILPYYHIDVLKSLAKDRDVHMFILCPSPRQAGSGQSAIEEGCGNSLLLSMGKAGADCLDRVLERADDAAPVFHSFEGSSILCRIQEDVRACMDVEHGGRKPATTGREDLSLQLHQCHSPLREVEALQDFLLHLFSKRRDIQPHEVLVMTPDIEGYSPYVRSVLGRGEPFAYNIADVKARFDSPVFSAFFEILELAGRRFEVSFVMRLLEKDAIREKFGITGGDLAYLKKWVKETRIRWGIDEAHRNRLEFPAYGENSWASGIRRMLLGSALKGEEDESYFGILPYGEIEGSLSVLLGRFVEFIQRLSSLVMEMGKPRPLNEWGVLLEGIIDGFFGESSPHQEDLRTIRNEVRRLWAGEDSLFHLTGFDSPLSLKPIHHYLQENLDTVSRRSAYMKGGITFAGFIPMRCIPFKVICLLGMNIDAFPRNEVSLAFDLMAKNPRKADRSIREGDRHLFLETLLSAREVLYVSHVGRDMKDNGEIPPSVLVSELLEYVRENFCFSPEETGEPVVEALTFSHRLHPFSPEYFRPESRLYSYSRPHYHAALALSGGKCASPAPSEKLRLPGQGDGGIVLLDDLTSFFRNPARFLLRKRLGVYPEFREEAHFDREFFQMSRLDRTSAAERCISLRLEDRDDGGCFRALKLQEILPPLVLGECEFEMMLDRTSSLVEEVRRLIASSVKLDPIEVEVPVGNYVLRGHIKNARSCGILRYFSRQIGGKHRLLAWIEHLALCLSGSRDAKKASIILGRLNDKKPLARTGFTEVPDALEHLKSLIDVFQEGTTRPVPFFPKTSYAFAENYKSGRGIIEAAKVWDGDRWPEKSDDAISILFRDADPLKPPLFDEFKDLAIRVYGPVLERARV